MTRKAIETGSPWNNENAEANFAELYADALPLGGLMAPAAGFLGTGTVYKSSVKADGDFIKTQIFIDLAGAKSSTTDLDIIGNTGAAHIGQILAAVNGAIVGGTVTCLEAPTGGVTDIDLYDATVATGAFDAGIEALTEAALLTAGDAWTLGEMKALTILPGPNVYLYLCCGAGGTADTYTAGKFMIELIGV
jgi:hypothetical protein